METITIETTPIYMYIYMYIHLLEDPRLFTSIFNWGLGIEEGTRGDLEGVGAFPSSDLSQ